MDVLSILAAYVVMEGTVLAIAALFLLDCRRSTRREWLRHNLALALQF